MGFSCRMVVGAVLFFGGGIRPPPAFWWRRIARRAVLEVRPMMAVDLLQGGGRHAQVAGGIEDGHVLLHHEGRGIVAQNVSAVLAFVTGVLGNRGPAPAELPDRLALVVD